MNDKYFSPIGQQEQAASASRRTRWIIGRANELGVTLDIRGCFPLVKGVIAKGDRIGAQLIEGAANLAGDTEAATDTKVLDS